MGNTKLLMKLLRLKEIKINWFRFEMRDKELHIGIKPYKTGCRCQQCGRRCKIVCVGENRSWTDVTILGRKIVLWYAPKEIICPTHGRAQEDIPWAAPYARATYRLEYLVCSFSKVMTQKAAAEILKMSASTLSDILHRVITRVRIGHKIRGLVTLGVDEISYCKGRKFATIVYDLDRSVVVWAGLGKGRETIDKFFNTELSKQQRLNITWASSDMSRAYTGAIKHHCQNAKLVIDRFHLVKALNEAVDAVRKEEWRDLDVDGRKAVRGLRWLLGMGPHTRTKSQTRFLNALGKSNRRIHRAWVLKDEFDHFWSYNYLASAESFLKRWMTAALKSRIPSMRTFVGTLKAHYANIITFIERPLTNAVAEGVNRILKIVKNRASGFRNLDSFTDLIFLTKGDVDIVAQIPAGLRSV